WLGSYLVLGCSEGSAAESSSGAPTGASVTPNSPGLPGGATAGNPVGTPGLPQPPTTPSQGPILDGDGNEVDVVPNLEDEEEVLVQFELPSAGERYVYAANPDSNSVAVIDSQTLAIQ